MKVTLHQAEKNSSKGKMVIEELLVNEKGEMEPVIIIRASELAARAAVLALADAARMHSYPQRQQDDIMAQMRKVHEWQGANTVMVPQATVVNVKKASA